MNKQYLPLLADLSTLLCTVLYANMVHGELKTWHQVIIDFEGPQSSETGDSNPLSPNENYFFQ